ncbi:MAG: FkbM family methyltransferase [Candidatus Promineifilaceae bacterium]
MSNQNIEVNIGETAYSVAPGKYDHFWRLAASGSWEPETFDVIKRFAKHDQAYIDIGTWVGPTLLFGAQHANTAFGFEPDPVAHAEAEKNLALNPAILEKTKLLKLGITVETGNLRMGSLRDQGDSMSSVLYDDAEHSWEIEGIQFDDFLSRFQVGKCGFIKMDIEGGEYLVLPTMRAYLSAAKPTLLISFHPRFLGNQFGKGLRFKAQRFTVRLTKMLRLLPTLNAYTHHYDMFGNKLSIAQILKLGLRGNLFSIVCTEQTW